MENRKSEEEMGSNVLGIRHVSGYRRVASIAVMGLCILCSFPQRGICFEDREITHIFTPENIENPEALIKEFDKIEERLRSSQDPLEETLKIFQALVNAINTRYGLDLTVPKMFKLVRENLHLLQLPLEIQRFVLASIALIEIRSPETAFEYLEKWVKRKT